MPLCDLIDGLNAGMHMLAKYRQGSYRHWSLTSWTVHGACVLVSFYYAFVSFLSS